MVCTTPADLIGLCAAEHPGPPTLGVQPFMISQETETQGSWSVAYTLDPMQDRLATATATTCSTSTQTVNDCADGG